MGKSSSTGPKASGLSGRAAQPIEATAVRHRTDYRAALTQVERGEGRAAAQPSRRAQAASADRADAAAGALSRRPRRWRMLLERDVAEIERRLRLYRENAPKRIAEDLKVHVNTVCSINLGRHPVQVRLRRE